jgi:EAL domain-containing protein (putative c-di-GMP-specific phosphodiesterase class I)
VVAEGIEFPEQSATLKELGCDTGQGFYFAKPMETEHLIRFLEDRAGAADGTVLPAGSD